MGEPCREFICAICGERRPLEKEQVITYQLKDLGVTYTYLRFCNDKEECITGAEAKAISGRL